jgi:SAM-dependent methyltransferase
LRLSRVLDARRIAPNKDAPHPFDLQYGLDTGDYLSPREIVTGHAHDALNYGYSAIAPSVFREAMKRWRAALPPTAAQPVAYRFVDVGAGKGRALLLASELPFRKVIGVELSAELARTARRNAARWRALGKPRAEIRVMHQDALAFSWPRPPLLVYLYNPFQCELVEGILDRIEARIASGRKSLGKAKPGPGSASVDLLYVNPICADVLSRRRGCSLVWTARIDMDEADQAADPYGTTFDRVSCYRLRR